MNRLQETRNRMLKDHDLRLTEPRGLILTAFLEREHALSYTDLEALTGQNLDRVTLYRTLKTFVAKGMLHTIPDGKDGVRYALCATHCHDEHEHHQHNHVHFKCRVCETTQCIDTVGIPAFLLPEGFRMEEASLLVQGVCNKCAA